MRTMTDSNDDEEHDYGDGDYNNFQNDWLL